MNMMFLYIVSRFYFASVVYDIEYHGKDDWEILQKGIEVEQTDQKRVKMHREWIRIISTRE